MKVYKVYNGDYEREPYNDYNQPEFASVHEAAEYIFDELLPDDKPFMIGDETKIVAIVFQGHIYV